VTFGRLIAAHTIGFKQLEFHFTVSFRALFRLPFRVARFTLLRRQSDAAIIIIIIFLILADEPLLDDLLCRN
jgi:hypothetical protein